MPCAATPRRGARFGPLPARRGGPTPYIQVIDAGGGVEVIGTEQASAAGRGSCAATWRPASRRATSATPRWPARTCACSRCRGRRGLRRPARPLAGARRRRARPPAARPRARLRGRRRARRRRSGGSRRATSSRRSSHVTEAARHIAATEDLGRRIEVETQDEVGELAAHFNAMLDTLERSVAASASSWPTPRTSCARRSRACARTSRCWRSPSCAADERARLLADVEEQIERAGMLVADLIELARGDEPRREREDVRLDRPRRGGRGARAAARAGCAVRGHA